MKDRDTTDGGYRCLGNSGVLAPVAPSKSSGPLAQPVVSDLFFNIAKYIFHSELSILHYMLW